MRKLPVVLPMLLLLVLGVAFLQHLPIEKSRAQETPQDDSNDAEIQDVETVTGIDGNISEGEYESGATFLDGTFELSWSTDGEYILISMAAETTGWVAIGFDPDNRMEGADMVIGWVADSGEAQCVDAYATGPTGPHPPDTELGGEDSILEYSGAEGEGRTVIEFMRPLAGDDEFDKSIPLTGELVVIVAFGSDDEFSQRHTSRETGVIVVSPDEDVGAETTTDAEEITAPGAVSIKWQFHAGLMGLAVCLIALTVYLAKRRRSFSGWITMHRSAGVSAATVAILGLLSAIVMINSRGSGHFAIPHTWLGAIGIILIVATPVIGTVAVNLMEKGKHMRIIHRWFGWCTAVIVVLTLLIGISMVAG